MSTQKQHDIVATLVSNHPNFMTKHKFSQKDINKLLKQRRRDRKAKNAKH